MKKTSLFLIGLAFAGILAACGTPNNTVSSSSADVDAKGYTLFRTSGILTGHDTAFAIIPASFKKAASKTGTVERIDYTTDAYGDGVTYQKYANVYLPYGYDATASKNYDIIYYQHGDKRSQDVLVRPGETTETKNQLDHLFDEGGITPCIIVFQTFYLCAEDANYGHADGDLAGDTGTGVPANYDKEMYEDLLPTVEAKYKTYANKDVSNANLKATRQHRAFAGYSRGAARTWAMFIQDFDYFQWYIPMSCFCTGTSFNALNTSEGGESDRFASPWGEMKSTIDAHAGQKFYIYASTGNKNDIPAMRTWANYLLTKSDISYGFDTTKNNFGFTISNYEHVDTFVPYYFYNSLQVVFH